jgi:hypothetical protein
MQAITGCRRPGGRSLAGSGAASPRIRTLVFRENGLMATDDADQITIERVLAPSSSLDPGIADIVAGRLHAMIVT